MSEASSFENPSDTVLHRAHMGAAAGHLVQAIYSFYLTNVTFKGKGQYYLTNPISVPLPDAPAEVLTASATSQYALGNVVATFPLLSSINHLWASFFQESYLKQIATGSNPVRWAEYGISAGLMTFTIAQLSGISDMKTLFPMLIANGLMQYTGLTVEQNVAAANDRSSSPPTQLLAYQNAWQHETLGFAAFLAIWVPIFLGFFTALDRSPEPVPDIVFGIIFVLFSLFLVFGLTSIAQIRGVYWKKNNHFRLTNFRQVELRYIILSFVAKTLLTNMTLFGVIREGMEPAAPPE